MIIIKKDTGVYWYDVSLEGRQSSALFGFVEHCPLEMDVRVTYDMITSSSGSSSLSFVLHQHSAVSLQIMNW
jgi:hypothetical protein